MEKVVLDSDGRVRLGTVNSELAITDSAGKTLAYLLPPAVYQQYMQVRLASEPTPEELDAARQEQGGLNLSEVLTHLADVERQWKEQRG